MKKLDFKSTDEFSEYFKGKSQELTTAIVESIRDAFMFQKKTATLFQISFDGSDSVFEISLSHKEWVASLETCLSHYEEWEMGDDAIDTFLLIKEIKSW
jgi:hypothetical protein